MWRVSCAKRPDLPLFFIDATTARGMYDPYSVLGLSRTAGEDEVKHAFRRLAKRFHPDTPEGASDKGRRFKDLSIAYEILGDARKRRAYDRGEIDAHGNPRAGYRPPPPEPEPEPSFTARASTRPSEPPPGASSAQSQRGEGPSASFRSAFERAFGGNVGGTAPKSESRVEDLFAEFFGDRQEAATRRAKDGEASGLPSATTSWGLGELVCAAVVWQDGDDDHPSPEELVGWTAGRIAGFKRPRRIVPVEALPTNAAGKVDKRVLRERLTG